MSQFEYVAVLISIIVGLSLTQLLRGVGRLVATEDGPRPYWVHLVWTFYAFMMTALFWWWEFRLAAADWSLPMYIGVIIYATLYFFLSLVVQPGRLDGINSYKEYYYSRRSWIFGLIIALILWDFVDTLMKGFDYFFELGVEYLAINITIITASIVAIITPNERYHEISAVLVLIAYVVFQYRNYVVIA